MRIIILTFLLCLSLSFVPFTFGSKALLKYEVKSVSSYSEMNDFYTKDSLGFELYKKFHDEYGDFLTINLQMRFAFNSLLTEENNVHRYRDFSSWDDYNKVIEFHNAYAQWKLLYGKLNLKLGHYDILYGLEPNVDTHQPLVQKLVLTDLHMKKDWGIFVEGSLEDFDYGMSLTLGSGMGIHREDDSYLLSARITTPPIETYYGISFLHGNLLNTNGTILLNNNSTKVSRAVLHLKHSMGEFSINPELMFGLQEDDTVTGALFEVAYQPAQHDQLQLYVQYQFIVSDFDMSFEENLNFGVIGIEYQLSNPIYLSLNYRHDFGTTMPIKERLIRTQLYIFY